MPLALSKPPLTASASPPFEAGRKLGTVEMALVWKLLHEDPACPSRVVLAKVAQSQVPIAVSVRHLNRLRAKWHLNRRKGRPSGVCLHSRRHGRPTPASRRHHLWHPHPLRQHVRADAKLSRPDRQAVARWLAHRKSRQRLYFHGHPAWRTGDHYHQLSQHPASPRPDDCGRALLLQGTDKRPKQNTPINGIMEWTKLLVQGDRSPTSPAWRRSRDLAGVTRPAR